MGSVRFDGDDESQPSTSDGKKYISSKNLLHDSGATNYASVPRKLRSVIKKRARESIILPSPISRKKRRISNGVEKIRENGAKKSRLIMKRGYITKDEEEVAETLNALADMFSDIAKGNEPVLDGEPSKIKSSSIAVAGNPITAAEDSVKREQEESAKVDTRVTLEAACHSSAKVENCRFLNNAEQPELELCKQSVSPNVCGVQSYLSLGRRPEMSGPDMTQSCERMIVQDKVSASEIQYSKYHCTKEDKYKGLLTPPTVLSSETQGSCLVSSANRFPAWSENTSSATQPSVNVNSFTADKIHYPQVLLEPKKSWKRCSAHVCIARLIKVLQKSETSKSLLPTQLTTSGGIEQGLHTSMDSQKRRINGPYDVLPFNGFTNSASEKDLSNVTTSNPSHNSLYQNQQQYPKTSVVCSSLKQGSEFLSLAAGGSDTSEGINRSGNNLEALKQFHMSYQHPQNLSAMHFSLLQSGYSSTFGGHTSAEAASQVRLPPYLSNTFGSNIVGHKLELQQQQQQQLTSQVRAQYNTGGVVNQQLNSQNRGRDSASLLNYAQALFPNLHSALNSKNRHFSPPFMPSVDSSPALSNLETHHHHRLNSAAALYSDNIQLLCNQHL